MAVDMAFLFRSMVLALAGLVLVAANQPIPPAVPAITVQDQHDVRCAAAFAVVATLQARGDKNALSLPPLAIRGKRYLGLVGERLATQTGLTGDAVRDLLTQAARSIGPAGAADVARSCLGELDTVVPPRPAPAAPACLAMLDIYAQVLESRDPGDPIVARLRQESAALSAAAHALLQSRGLDDAGQAAAITRERAAVRAALSGGAATLDADDFAQCRQLAAAQTR